MALLAVSGSGRSVAVTGSGHTVQVIGKHQDVFFDQNNRLYCYKDSKKYFSCTMRVEVCI